MIIHTEKRWSFDKEKAWNAVCDFAFGVFFGVALAVLFFFGV